MYSSTKPEYFLDGLPDIYRGKARQLLAHLQRHGVQWSNNGELLLPTGEKVEGSHGIDFLKEALVASRKKSPSRPLSIILLESLMKHLPPLSSIA